MRVTDSGGEGRSGIEFNRRAARCGDRARGRELHALLLQAPHDSKSAAPARALSMYEERAVTRLGKAEGFGLDREEIDAVVEIGKAMTKRAVVDMDGFATVGGS